MRALALLILLTPAVLGSQTVRDSVLSVSITRSFRIVPDRASFFVVVDGTAETSGDALTVGNTKLEAVLRALRSISDGVVIGTPIPVSVAPPQNLRGFSGAQSVPMITARTAVRVTVTRLNELARAYATATDAGATAGSVVTYQSSVADSVRRTELTAALSLARQDAAAMARALDGRVGALVEVLSTSDDRTFFAQSAMLPMEGYSGQPSLAPDVLGSVTVTARFRLVR